MLRELLVSLAGQDLQDLKANPALLVNLAALEDRDQLDRLAAQDLKVNQEHQDILEALALLDLKEDLDHKGHLVRRVNLAHPVAQDQLVHLDLQDLQLPPKLLFSSLRIKHQLSLPFSHHSPVTDDKFA